MSLFPDKDEFSGNLTVDQALQLGQLLQEAAALAVAMLASAAEICGTCGFAKVHRGGRFNTQLRKWEPAGAPSCRGNGCPEASR